MFYGMRYLSHCSTRFVFNLYSLTGSRVWPLGSRDVIGHMITGTTEGPFLLVVYQRRVTISHGCQDIEPQTFRGHVTSSVTWPLEPQLAISYWSSTMSLSRTVAEILSIKNNWVTSLTIGITWRHWSRDHWNRSWSFPIGHPLTPCPYLAPLLRYWTSNILGSRPWPFRVTWRHQSRDHWNRRWSFPIGHPLTPCPYLPPLPRY